MDETDILDQMEQLIVAQLRTVKPSLDTDPTWPARWERHMAREVIERVRYLDRYPE